MNRISCVFAIVLTLGVAVDPVNAQNTANVSVQLQPSYNAGSTPPSLYKFAVCIGTPDDLDKYGVDLTNGQGIANQFTNLPVGVPVTITVSGARGYRGWQTTRTLTAGWSNHIQAGLQPGTGGPACNQPYVPPPPPPPGPPVVVEGTVITAADTPNITEFKINGGASVLAPGQVPMLQFKFTGPVTEVRISEMSDMFPDPTAGWKPFTATRLASGLNQLALPTGTGKFTTSNSRETVYMQLRAGTKTSRIASASIDVRAEYKVPGGLFYGAARPYFKFNVRGVTVPLPAQQCTMAVAGNNLVFQAPRLSPAGGCIYDLFVDGALFAGWRFVGFTFNSSPGCASTITRQQSSNPASIAAQVWVPLMDLGATFAGCSASLSLITIEGPAGNVWQRSFSK